MNLSVIVNVQLTLVQLYLIFPHVHGVIQFTIGKGKNFFRKDTWVLGVSLYILALETLRFLSFPRLFLQNLLLILKLPLVHRCLHYDRCNDQIVFI